MTCFRWAPHRLPLLPAILTLALGAACTTGPAPQAPDEARADEAAKASAVFVACTPAIRSASCAAQGSYPHVRDEHCEVSCSEDHKSVYAPKFIGDCSNSRLEDVCWQTVRHPTCQYYMDARGTYVVMADLGVDVGVNLPRGCSVSSISTVVLDARYTVVTMYPGP